MASALPFLCSFSSVPGCAGFLGTFRRPGLLSSLSACATPAVSPAHSLAGAPFPRPCRLLPFRYTSPSPGPLRVVRCLFCQVWGVTLAHRTRHRQDTQLRPTQRQVHHVVLHNDCGPQSQQAPPTRHAGYSGAVVVAAGAVPSSFSLSAPSIFTVAGAGFVSSSSSVCPSIYRGAYNDVTSVQDGI